jgi:hypothetical protein
METARPGDFTLLRAFFLRHHAPNRPSHPIATTVRHAPTLSRSTFKRASHVKARDRQERDRSGLGRRWIRALQARS